MSDSIANFKMSLEADGISMTEWAKANGFNIRTVRAVIAGELKAKRGVSHKIALAIGIKKARKAA